MMKIGKGVPELRALGKARGRVGNVCYYMLNGQSVVRSLPAVTRDPRTGAQINCRNKFSYITKLGSVFKSVIHVGYAFSPHVGMSAYSAFVKENIRRVTVDEVRGECVLKARQLVCAVGGMSGMVLSGRYLADGHRLQLRVVERIGMLDTTRCMLVVYEPEECGVKLFDLGCANTLQECMVDLPIRVRAPTFHAYCFCTDTVSKSGSNSSYVEVDRGDLLI
ncbi:MAG: hypothetical protein ACRDDZ_14045 [Marinifilaceae bacterium]